MENLTGPNKKAMDCVRCGVCKTSCPTYEETLNESMGARGRITLIGELQSTLTRDSEALSERIFSCILCGSCNNLCPLGLDITGENYKARETARKAQTKTRLAGFIVKHLFRRPEIMFGALHILNKISPYLPGKGTNFIRQIHNLKFDSPWNALTKRLSISKARNAKGRVALFPGCTVNFLSPSLGFALVEILNALQYDVVLPRNVLCCGAPLMSMGLLEEARKQAERCLQIFKELSIDSVISLCPTCVHTMKDTYRALIGSGIDTMIDSTDFIYQHKESLQAICEEIGSSYRGALINYHHPCHSKNYLHLKKEAPLMLREIGLEITEDDKCCGFGGSFRFLYSDLSMRILQKREKAYLSSDMVITSCPNCILQFRGAKINSRHFVEIINIALRRETCQI